MRYSKLLGRTLRETPRGVETRAQELLLRGAFVKSAPGSLALLPLGWQVIERMRAVLNAELAALGAAEFSPLPALGQSTKDRGAGGEAARGLAACRPAIRQQYPLAAVHEQALAALAGSLALSYRDLPAAIFCVQPAARAESHAMDVRFAAHFMVHCAYRFEGDPEALAAAVRELGAVHAAAMARMGTAALALPRPVSATVAGNDLLALSGAGQAGDETVVCCGSCDYRALLGAAVSHLPPFEQSEEPGRMEAVLGEGIIGTAELCEFLNIPRQKTTKTLLLQADDRVIAACVRGEYDVSEPKLAELLGCAELNLAAPFVVRELTGAEVGFAGPLGLPPSVEAFWDHSTAGRVNFEAGANRTDYHCINLNFGRDLPAPARFVDIRAVREGEKCAACGQGTLALRKALRLGHVSAPGPMYSKALKATVNARDGKSLPLQVACAGVDLLRLLAVIVEQHCDDKGIVWPAAVAPFAVHLVSLPGGEARAAELYGRLERGGVAVLWDDRAEAAGVKFRDADLIGIPMRFVVSGRTGEQVECKARTAAQGELVSMEQAISLCMGQSAARY